MFEVFLTDQFKQKARTIFSKEERDTIEIFIEKELSVGGDVIGKPLTFPFFREKKIKGKRLYYLIYKEILLILIVEASNKKEQKNTINKIKEDLPKFKELGYKYYGELNR